MALWAPGICWMSAGLLCISIHWVELGSFTWDTGRSSQLGPRVLFLLPGTSLFRAPRCSGQPVLV